eukprot:2580688-Prymnesium_polylepis.2
MCIRDRPSFWREKEARPRCRQCHIGAPHLRSAAASVVSCVRRWRTGVCTRPGERRTPRLRCRAAARVLLRRAVNGNGIGRCRGVAGPAHGAGAAARRSESMPGPMRSRRAAVVAAGGRPGAMGRTNP